MASAAAHVPARRSDAGEDRVRGLALVVGMVVVMWALEFVDLLGANLDSDGIHPRDVDGLPGIALSPFLHAGFGHLIGNTIPFLLLGATIALGGLVRTAAVVAIVALVGGFGTWLFAPSNTHHIGARGLVFGFAAYLVARGVFSRRLLHLAVGLLVLAVYGTTLLFGLVPTPGVSWQGHLFGAVGGIVAARALDARATRPPSPAAW
jgi:membrane associated rhomboid family serine protease